MKDSQILSTLQTAPNARPLARPAPVPAARVEPPAPRLSSPPPAGAMYRTGGKIDVSEKIVGRNGGGGR